MTIEATIDNKKIFIIINLKASKNFMSKLFANKLKFFMRKKFDYYDLIIVNENSLHNKNKKINEKIMSLLIIIQQYYEKFIL